MDIALGLFGLNVSMRDTQGRHTPILRGVTFQIAAGEMVAIMGPSGSGKTTLLYAISGILPYGGQVLVGGKDVAVLSSQKNSDWRLHNIGFVFQSYNLQPHLTVLQNIMLPGIFAGDAPDAVEQRARELMEHLAINGKSTDYPSRLSGGEMQRAAIARALICSPSLILADEPTGNLDSANAAYVMELMREVCTRQETAALIVTHNPEIAEKCNRTLLIKDGRIDEK